MSGPELSFGSAEELFEALASSDAIARRNVLGWVATHPREAIDFGQRDGGDVLDVLFGLINRNLDYPYWEDISITISAFDSPRVTDYFVELLAGAVESGQAYDAASALSHRLGAEGLRERLVEILLSEGGEERLAATAELLAGEEGLPAAAAVRVAALEPEHPAPALDDRSRNAWLEELAGPVAELTRERLEQQGLPAMHVLALDWERIDTDTREWLLDWASDAAAEEPVAAAVVTRALEQGSELAPAGLRAAAMLPTGSVPGDSLDRWAAEESAELRAAAIAAGAGVDLEALLASEREPEVLVAAIGRLAEQGDAEAVRAIAPHLGSGSLAVRSAARAGLVAVGPQAVESLRPLVRNEVPETRAAAVRALLDLEDDEWLARELLDEGSG